MAATSPVPPAGPVSVGGGPAPRASAGGGGAAPPPPPPARRGGAEGPRRRAGGGQRGGGRSRRHRHHSGRAGGRRWLGQRAGGAHAEERGSTQAHDQTSSRPPAPASPVLIEGAATEHGL